MLSVDYLKAVTWNLSTFWLLTQSGTCFCLSVINLAIKSVFCLPFFQTCVNWHPLNSSLCFLSLLLPCSHLPTLCFHLPQQKEGCFLSLVLVSDLITYLFTLSYSKPLWLLVLLRTEILFSPLILQHSNQSNLPFSSSPPLSYICNLLFTF